MARVKFWTRLRHARNDVWKLVWCEDPSDVPEICWRTYNREFWRRHQHNELYPADELAAYQAGCLAMIEARGHVAEIAAGVKPTTYIISAGLRRLMQFTRQEVIPRRQEFRELFDMCRVHGTFDICDWLEAQPGPSPDARVIAQRKARAIIDNVLPRCSAETQRGLNALLAHRLVAWAAANALGIPRSTFRNQRDNKWFPEFREAFYAH